MSYDTQMTAPNFPRYRIERTVVDDTHAGTLVAVLTVGPKTVARLYRGDVSDAAPFIWRIVVQDDHHLTSLTSLCADLRSETEGFAWLRFLGALLVRAGMPQHDGAAQ